MDREFLSEKEARQRKNTVRVYKAHKFNAANRMKFAEFEDHPVSRTDNVHRRIRWLVMKILELKMAVERDEIAGPDAYRMLEAYVEEVDLVDLVPLQMVGAGGKEHERAVSALLDGWFRRDWFRTTRRTA